MPQVLSALWELLYAQEGHLVEGIFRVSPSQSAFKTAQKLYDQGALSKIQDPESMAQLIKLWGHECLRVFADRQRHHSL